MALEITMDELDVMQRSGPVVVVPYQERWPEEYRRLAGRIREAVGPAAVRVDHIGSTAVPGLAAKDVIDVQVTVADLDRAGSVVGPLGAAGFVLREGIVRDEFRSMAPEDPGLRKLYMREPEGGRRAHVHIREAGRFNQRYALLFRDYLRASEAVRVEYEVAKRRAARLFPESIDGYLYLKDPVFHIIYEAATLWARLVDWAPSDAFE